jgi:hypothetical protein
MIEYFLYIAGMVLLSTGIIGCSLFQGEETKLLISTSMSFSGMIFILLPSFFNLLQ